MVGGSLRVLQWRWGLSAYESQAAEYAAVVGVDALRREWVGSDRSLRRVERRVQKKRAAA